MDIYIYLLFSDRKRCSFTGYKYHISKTRLLNMFIFESLATKYCKKVSQQLVAILSQIIVILRYIKLECFKITKPLKY